MRRASFYLTKFSAPFRRPQQAPSPPAALSLQDTVAILYTSGTSGEAKGVMLTVGNLDHMLSCTKARLDQLMGPRDVPDRVFHYLPFCFAGSWILLLSCLSGTSVLTISRICETCRGNRRRRPNYFLNVPTLLERIRAGVEGNIRKRGGMIAKIFDQRRRPRGLGSMPKRPSRGIFSGWAWPAS